MTDKKLICLECQKAVANTANVLARHLRSAHDIEWADYVVKHEHAGVWPTCACGCNEKLVWRKGGFGKYLRGHDGKAPVKLTVQAGWVLNPFTGREERVGSDDEIALLEQCFSRGDAVTHDHGIRVPWEDSSGRVRFIVPSFSHLKRKLIFVLDSPSEPDYGRRVVGLKQWCDMHAHMLLVLRRGAEGFDVVGAHKPKEVSDVPKEKAKGKGPDGTR